MMRPFAWSKPLPSPFSTVFSRPAHWLTYLRRQWHEPAPVAQRLPADIDLILTRRFAPRRRRNSQTLHASGSGQPASQRIHPHSHSRGDLTMTLTSASSNMASSSSAPSNMSKVHSSPSKVGWGCVHPFKAFAFVSILLMQRASSYHLYGHTTQN